MPKRKNEAAVALGRMGASKGGHARAAKMTPEQRSASARKAVQARWGVASQLSYGTLKNLDDEYKWALETAAAVRAGDWNAVDRDALLAELEHSIAGGFRRQLYLNFRDALRAKLSLELAPKTDSAENENLLDNAVEGINSLLWACPSMRCLITEEFFTKSYAGAKYIIGDRIQLPAHCPYSVSQILQEVELRG